MEWMSPLSAKENSVIIAKWKKWKSSKLNLAFLL